MPLSPSLRANTLDGIDSLVELQHFPWKTLFTLSKLIMPLRKSNVRLFVFGLFYLLYLVIGASIFSAIEGPQEKALVKELKEQRALFLKSHQKQGQNCISGMSFYWLTFRKCWKCVSMKGNGQSVLNCICLAGYKRALGYLRHMVCPT